MASIEFVLQGKLDGVAITPHSIGLSQSNGFIRQVNTFTFMDYRPVYDEAALDRFAAKGAEAWVDVPDAAQWVREVRGQ